MKTTKEKKLQALKKAQAKRWPKKRKLTFKQRKFIKAYMNNHGNQTKAALEALEVSNRRSAQVRGSEMLSNPMVKEGIEIAMEAQGITDDQLVKDTYEIVKAGIQNKDKSTPTDALRGIETLWKAQNKLGTTQEHKTIHLEYNAMNKSELLEERKRLKDFWAGLVD